VETTRPRDEALPGRGAMPYRLLALDVDGTLLTSANELPEANRLALHRAHRAGLTVCLCTGRSYCETRPVIEQIGLDLDVVVCVFGAIISDARTGQTLRRWPMARQTAVRLIGFLRSLGHPVLVLQDPTEAGTDYYYIPGQRNRPAYERWLRLTPTTIRQVETWPADAPEPLRIGIVEEPDRIEALRAELRAKFHPDELRHNAIFAPNYGLYVLECFAPEVSKWHALRQLAQDRGIRPEQIVAIGDDINDLEMIREAGLGVAMGNAVPAIRQVARAHTGTNDQAGVCAFIERLLQGGPVPHGSRKPDNHDTPPQPIGNANL